MGEKSAHNNDFSRCGQRGNAAGCDGIVNHQDMVAGTAQKTLSIGCNNLGAF